MDHLTRLDKYIKQGFAKSELTVGIFIDLKKSYDTTWRYGILKDMHDMGLRSKLPQYVEQFLINRSFQVSINNELSLTYTQQAGVPQGSILNVTLFAIKINAIAETIPPHIHSFLFVDDLQIVLSGHNINHVLANLQPVIHALVVWTYKNGFAFSTDKTCCVTFH